MSQKSLDEKRKAIIDFVRNNPKATYKLIRTKLKLHPERIFKGGMKEIFNGAHIAPPRNFKRKTKEENRNIIIDYIRKHPQAGRQMILRDTKISLSNVFNSIQKAYEEAGIEYPRKESYKKSAKEKKEELIKTTKENPNITVEELAKKIRTNPYRFFKNIKELYEKAGINRVLIDSKRKINKRQIVIEFIKNNPAATQREINLACRTHVQQIFKEGILGAYKEASMEYPYKRLRLYGSAKKEIRKRALNFEDKIAINLSCYGKINRLVKIKRGFADIIIERKGKKAIIEVKDYEAKDISISQVKQLNNYLKDYNCKLGFLVCFKKPKKDSFLIGENKILILEESELKKIPDLIDGAIV